MSILIDYNNSGVLVVDPQPTGPAGSALNDNLKLLVDRANQLSADLSNLLGAFGAHATATGPVHGATVTADANQIVLRDNNGGIQAFTIDGLQTITFPTDGNIFLGDHGAFTLFDASSNPLLAVNTDVGTITFDSSYPISGNGSQITTLNADYLQTGTVDRDRLGSGGTGAGSKVLADNNTWVDPSSLQGTSGYSGYSGVSGFSGKSGFSGYSGISGYSGYSGISGFSGFSGKSGFSGISGYSGYSGKSGFSGVPAGLNTQVQFNDGGSFGSDGDFSFDKASNTLTIGALQCSGGGNFNDSVSIGTGGNLDVSGNVNCANLISGATVNTTSVFQASGSSGINDSFSFTDQASVVHNIVITGGIITQWNRA